MRAWAAAVAIFALGCTVTEETEYDFKSIKLSKLAAAGRETRVTFIRRCLDHGQMVEKGATGKVIETYFVFKEKGAEDRVGWRASGLIDPERPAPGSGVVLPPTRVEAFYQVALDDKRVLTCPRTVLTW